MRAINYSQDYIYGKRLSVKQPEEGFRASIDGILLQACVQPQDSEFVLDVGTGIATASLCLATRYAHTRIFGIEVQRENVACAVENVHANNFKGRIEIIHGNLLAPPPRLAAGSFSHVMTNPPYYDAASHKVSPIDQKASSNFLQDITLEQWIRFCLLMANHKGMIYIVHVPEYLDKILAVLSGKAGSIAILPFWKRAGEKANRIIVGAIKGNNGPTRLLSGLTLHTNSGDYTKDIENILRHQGEIKLW